MPNNNLSAPQGSVHANSKSVLQNAALRRKLEELPASTQTLTLSISNEGELSAPTFHPADHDSDDVDLRQFETVQQEVNSIGHAAVVPGRGQYVPVRRLASLADGSTDDVDYRIVGQLGSGGTGVVYQAHQRAIDREVALKVLKDNLNESDSSRERFLTEARVIGGLDHPNVIALHEVCVDQSGGLFYSMKRIDGTSWDKQIAQLTQQQNLDILLRVADAIRYAHSRGLIHRDVKPENVMLGRFGEVLMADWGLAISHSGDEESEDVGSSIGGTPAYMAPELARGDQKAIRFTTDVYLLGAVLFEILTGFPPHRGDTLLACINAAARNEIRATDVEGELLEIAMQAMSTDPAQRYASVDLFIAAIRDQRLHDESVRLVRRANTRLAKAGDNRSYEDFRLADLLLSEALDIWPENRHAMRARLCLQVQFARAAGEAGDYDLALSLLEAAGQSDSEDAVRIRKLRNQRNAREQKVTRYSALFTHSPDAGLLLEIETGVVVEANHKFGALLGYDRKEVIGKRVGDLNLWACPQRRNKLVQELTSNGGIEEFEAVFLRRDGEPIDVLINGQLTEVDEVPMVVSTIRDISIRKRAENELKRSRERLRDLQRLAGIGTWSYDVRSGEVTWSEEAFALSGRRKEDGVPSREEYIEMIHPQDRPAVEKAMRESVYSGAAYELLIRQKRANGHYRRMLLRGQPIPDENGNTVEVYGVLISQPDCS